MAALVIKKVRINRNKPMGKNTMKGKKKEKTNGSSPSEI